MADTPTGETVNPGDSQTEATNTSTPVLDNASAAEVERLRKEKEQADLRIRQLQNEAEARKKADAEAEAKRLEEKEEYKTLYESTQEKLQSLESAQQNAERQAQLSSATDSIYKDYSPEVVDVAKTAGLVLTDDSEASQTALKEKLDSIKSKVAPGLAVTSNNPSDPAQAQVTREQLVTKGDDGISPLAWAGAKGDETVARKYAGSLEAVKQMKRNAGLKVD